tara:strand:+ start:13840 stop:14193 length:354 start_codon:yes stop_codon:yes gene_type:complete
MPVHDIDFGAITLTENWGRLFINWGGNTVILHRHAYKEMAEAISQFIEPEEKSATDKTMLSFDFDLSNAVEQANRLNAALEKVLENLHVLGDGSHGNLKITAAGEVMVATLTLKEKE